MPHSDTDDTNDSELNICAGSFRCNSQAQQGSWERLVCMQMSSNMHDQQSSTTFKDF